MQEAQLKLPVGEKEMDYENNRDLKWVDSVAQKCYPRALIHLGSSFVAASSSLPHSLILGTHSDIFLWIYFYQSSHSPFPLHCFAKFAATHISKLYFLPMLKLIKYKDLWKSHWSYYNLIPSNESEHNAKKLRGYFEDPWASEYLAFKQPGTGTD